MDIRNAKAFIKYGVDETGTYIFLSAAMMIISCVFSLGVLNFQKLHTIKLLEKAGTDIEKCTPPPRCFLGYRRLSAAFAFFIHTEL